MGAGRGAALVVACAAGIYGAYLTQGYVQESMCARGPPPCCPPVPFLPLILPPPPRPPALPPPNLHTWPWPLVPPAGRAVSPPTLVSGQFPMEVTDTPWGGGYRSTQAYAPDGAHFPHLKSLHGLQSFGCFFAAGLVLLLLPGARGEAGKTGSVWAYLKPSITNSIGPTLGIIALKNIPFSAQLLVKSCKIVTVMLGNTILSGMRYSAKEYLCAVVIVAGLCLFSFQSSTQATTKLTNPNALLGYTLCFFNLTLDGYTNSAQDEIKRKYSGTSAVEMMCWMNFWCAIISGTYTFGFSSSGLEIVSFCFSHPQAFQDVLLYCICGAVGQLFIFFTLTSYGSLTNTLITTTRKFFSILLSSMISGSTLLPLQWGGVSLVFAGLFWNIWMKVQKSRAKSKKE